MKTVVQIQQRKKTFHKYQHYIQKKIQYDEIQETNKINIMIKLA